MKTLTWSTSLGVILTIAVIPACGSRFFDILLQNSDPDESQHPSNIEPDPENPGRSTRDRVESSNTDQNDHDDGNQNDENQLVKKLKDYAKRLFDGNDPAPVRVNLFGINFLPSQARKNLLGHNRSPVIILVHQDSKHLKKNLLPPGYTQFSPSQNSLEFSEDSNQLNENNLREKPESSQEMNGGKMKLNSSINDFIHINCAKINFAGAIGLLNILKVRNENSLRGNPESSEQSNAREMKLNSTIKDFIHINRAKIKFIAAMGLLNIIKTRRNLLGNDRNTAIILVPQDYKQPNSQELPYNTEDSYQLNENSLRGNPESSEKSNAGEMKLNSTIKDFIHINSAKIKFIAALGLLNIIKTRKNLLGNDRNTAIILVPQDYKQPNSQDVPQNFEDSYQLQKKNILRTCNKPENSKQSNKKKIDTTIKDFFHIDDLDLNVTAAMSLINIITSRKNQRDHNRTPVMILVPQDYKQPNTNLIPPGYTQFRPSQEVVEFSEDSKQLNKNNLRASEQPENSIRSKKKTIDSMIKDFFHIDSVDLNVSEAIGAINILATRKNQHGHNRTPVMIIVPQDYKQPNSNLIPPGYTQFRPSQDVFEDSNKLNENILRGMPENSKETNAHEDKINTSIKDKNNAKLRIINAIGLFNILKINPEILKLKGLKYILRAKRSDEETEENDTSPKFKRRSIMRPGEVILGVPTRPEHLPQALPIHPGHTLLRPARGMLKSSIKFPLRDFGGSAVYGNLDNLGITYGKTRSRVRYTDFRKTNSNLLKKIQDAIQSSKITDNGRSHPLVVIEIDPSEIEAIKTGNQNQKNNNEVLDDLDGLFVKDTSDPMDLRRKSKNKSKHRDRSKNYGKSRTSSDEDKNESSSNSDSSIERNEGNPFTIHKNKYKQNWLWNHKLDGLHVNINPYAPQLNQLGPTGAELFFARKWWYFNQDDYKPMGRKR